MCSFIIQLFPKKYIAHRPCFNILLSAHIDQLTCLLSLRYNHIYIMVDQGSLTPGLGATSGLQVAFLWSSTEPFVYCKSQWRLLRGRQLIIMAGMERMEWHQTHRNHVFDTIPLILRQPLLRARPPQLRCHQPLVLNQWYSNFFSREPIFFSAEFLVTPTQI